MMLSQDEISRLSERSKFVVVGLRIQEPRDFADCVGQVPEVNYPILGKGKVVLDIWRAGVKRNGVSEKWIE